MSSCMLKLILAMVLSDCAMVLSDRTSIVKVSAHSNEPATVSEEIDTKDTNGTTSHSKKIDPQTVSKDAQNATGTTSVTAPTEESGSTTNLNLRRPSFQCDETMCTDLGASKQVWDIIVQSSKLNSSRPVAELNTTFPNRLTSNWCDDLLSVVVEQTEINQETRRKGHKLMAALPPGTNAILTTAYETLTIPASDYYLCGTLRLGRCSDPERMEFHLTPIASAWQTFLAERLGEPLIVYHGTKGDPETLAKDGLYTKEGMSLGGHAYYGPGIYSTTNVDMAKTYAKDWVLKMELYGASAGMYNHADFGETYRPRNVTTERLACSHCRTNKGVQITYETSFLFPVGAERK